jgi:hypothetical protein
MNWWNLSVMFVLPHERFLVGWEILTPDDKFPHNTFSLSLGIITIAFDWS